MIEIRYSRWRSNLTRRLIYSIVYEEAKEGETEKKEVMFGKKCTSQSGNLSNSSSIHGSVTSPVSPSQTMSCTVEDVLQLLRHLFVIYTKPENETSICKNLTLSFWIVHLNNLTHVYLYGLTYSYRKLECINGRGIRQQKSNE